MAGGVGGVLVRITRIPCSDALEWICWSRWLAA